MSLGLDDYRVRPLHRYERRTSRTRKGFGMLWIGALLLQIPATFAQLIPVTEAGMPFQCEHKGRLHAVLPGSVNGGHCHVVDGPPHR